MRVRGRGYGGPGRVWGSRCAELFVDIHPAGTSKESDICDLSINSDFAPLTLESMANTTYFVSNRKPI